MKCYISGTLVLRYLERIADHAEDVGESVAYTITGNRAPHKQSRFMMFLLVRRKIVQALPIPTQPASRLLTTSVTETVSSEEARSFSNLVQGLSNSFRMGLAPASTSRWQFEQTSRHLSISFLIESHDLMMPFLERPKVFVLLSTW